MATPLNKHVKLVELISAFLVPTGYTKVAFHVRHFDTVHAKMRNNKLSHQRLCLNNAVPSPIFPPSSYVMHIYRNPFVKLLFLCGTSILTPSLPPPPDGRPIELPLLLLPSSLNAARVALL